MCLQLRSGRRYGDVPVAATAFKTNLRYEELMAKALKMDDKLGELNEKLAAVAASRAYQEWADASKQCDDASEQCDDASEQGDDASDDATNSGEWSPVSLSPLSSPSDGPSPLPTPFANLSPLTTPPSSPPLRPTSDEGLEEGEVLSDMPDLEDDGYEGDDCEDDGCDEVTPPYPATQRSAVASSSAPPGSHHSAASSTVHPDSGQNAAPAGKKRRRPRSKKPRKQTAGRLAGKKRRRKGKRATEQETAAAVKDWTAPPKPHGNAFTSRPLPAKMKVDTADAAVNYKVTNGAYTARRLDSLNPVPWERLELDARGFQYFAWCGSVAYVILDSKDRVIAVLVPPPLENDSRPEEERWASTMERVGELFESKREAANGSFSTKQTSHRRGNFTAIATGVSYGGGQKKPGNLRHTKRHQDMLRDLTDDADVSRIANFQSDAMASYFPKVYAHVYDSLGKLSRSQPELHRNFRGGSVYPTCTFNLGPDTVCLDHNDCNNAPDVPCAITALGEFDADKGGELYLWDLALIIKFPPGTTILLSSASMRHGNLPTQPGERRYSMTQYCPGGLLRWVRHGLRPASSLSKADRKAIDGDHRARWAEVLGRLSKYDELEGDREWLVQWERSKA